MDISPSSSAQQAASQEEHLWQQNEEEIKEATFDAEELQHDQGVQSMALDLQTLRSFPVATLLEAQIITSAVAQSLQEKGITTVEQLVKYLQERN